MSSPVLQALTENPNEGIYRRNFFFFITDGILFTLAMGILGTTTVIPDFVRQLTDSEVLIGLSSTLFEIGWTLPQLFIARYLMRYARKKWWFVAPNIPTRLVMLIFAGLIVILGEGRPGAILVAFFLAYSITALGDGVVGVPWADLTGTSLDERWRARMFGVQAAIAGVIMLALAPVIGFILSDAGPGFPNNYALLFGMAGLMWALSILPGIFIHELPGGKAVEKVPSFKEYIPELGRLLRDDLPFRAMLITRLLTTLFAMAAPFYIGFATEQLGLSSAEAVPRLLAMQTIGTILGALAYTWLGAKNNVLYIRVALAIGLLLPISALAANALGPLPLYFGFLISGISLSNLFFGYLNWVVGYASPDQRPIYMGLFNTVATVFTLTSPLIAGTIAENFGYLTLFVIALMMGAAALYVTIRYIPNPRRAQSIVAAAAD